jgi:HK97 family phage major capsid protein
LGTGTIDGTSKKELNQALRTFIKTGDEKPLNALVVADDTAGGYLVIPDRAKEINKKLFDQSPIRRLARVVQISGGSYEEPVDHSDIGAEWVGETESRTETTNPSFGLVTIPCNESYAYIPVSQKMVDDSNVDIWAYLTERMVEKFGRQEGTAFATGNGVNQPTGFLSYDVSADDDDDRDRGTIQYLTSGHATLVKADGLLDVVYGLRAPYRQGATWLMNSTTALAVSKLKNGDGDYLWRDSLAVGQPNGLLGYPVEFCEDMPDIAAGAYPIAFANWKLAYTIVEKLGIRFLRDPYSDKPNVIVYAYRRVGGGVMNSEAIKLMKISE